MLGIRLSIDQERPFRVLFLGAHSDDIEIGCGGTILRLLQEYHEMEVCWVVFAAHGKRASEAEMGADLFLRNAKRKKVLIEGFRESFFPYEGAKIKEYFEKLKIDFTPELIFTHFRMDLHQDHRIINELTWNTFRDNLILEYEIIKYDGDLGNPNVFIHLDAEICHNKVQYLLESFETQSTRAWFSKDVFLSLLRLRGVESNSPYNYAEGFFCRKIVF
jgi:LmbE family N-acetylglucosaminyl deacetylase